MRSLVLAAAALGLAAPVLALAAPALALEPDAIRSQLESRFPVEVLRLEPVQHDGRQVYAATVMLQGGDYNDAFRVSRLMVDPASGALVMQSADALPGPDYRPRREGMEALR